MPTRTIAFCYAFMVGIAVSMRWPALGRWFPAWALAVAALAAAATASAWVDRRMPARRRMTLALLLACALCAGLLRHAATDRRPDLRIGTIVVADGNARFVGRTDWQEASRLRIRKDSPGAARIRIEGILRARVPVLDASGAPAMDAHGRWRFTESVQPQSSVDCVLDARLPVGAEVEVDAPFSAITNVVAIQATDGLQLGIVRVSSHIASFTRPGRGTPPVTLLARITDDPAVYPHQTVLTVTPAFAQTTPGGPFFKVSGGQVRVTARPGLPGYDAVARTEACGNDVVLSGELQTPQPASIPGGFDNRRYLANYGVFGQMFLWMPRERDATPPLRVVGPAGGTPRTSGALVMFSLRLRDRMLRVLKQTLPYPHSAFAGGVTLGLRYGLQNTECILAPETPQEGLGILRATHAPCSDFISEEFRRSGVNHVLAVSGLHVTIITVMLVGIFTALRLSRRAYVPVILLALVVFAIITGARPSTLRAVIMNGLFLLSWAYLGRTLQASVLIGAPIAAFLILMQNPAILVDPSFTLSFGAILSLALLTGPCHTVLSRFRGNDLLVLGIVVVGFHVVIALDWMYLTSPFSAALLAAATAGLFATGRWLARRGFRPIGDHGFADLPTAVNGFIAAQFAIQLGMMIPLSSYYFARWPVAGAVANVVAIPLIGVVLQLAMLSCLVGLIPGIGLYAALLLNAANWVFSTVFVLIAHYAGAWFPYPFTRRPTGFGLAVYFVFVGIFAFWPLLRPWLERQAWWKQPPHRHALVAACALLALVALPRAPRADGKTHVTILPVNYGSSVLVRSPEGKTILIDAGYAIRDRNRAVEAERNILPYLCRLGIRDLDAVVALSARPERLAGVSHVLKHCRVRQLVLPPGVAAMFDARHALVDAAVDAAFGDSTAPTVVEARDAIVGRRSSVPSLSLAEVLAGRRPTLANRLTGRAIRLVAGRPGMRLFPHPTENGDFAVEVLGPTQPEAESRVLGNGSLALRVHHGEFATLLTGDLDYDAVGHLMATHDPTALRATVLVAPTRGTWKPQGIRRDDARFAPALRAKLDDIVGVLLQTSGVRHVVFEFGTPRPVLKDGRDAERAHDVARTFYEERLGPGAVLSTQADGTIFLVSDGRNYDVETSAARGRQEPEAPPSLSEATFHGFFL